MLEPMSSVNVSPELFRDSMDGLNERNPSEDLLTFNTSSTPSQDQSNSGESSQVGETPEDPLPGSSVRFKVIE